MSSKPPGAPTSDATVQPILLGGSWCPVPATADTFAAVNPATGERSTERYPVTDFSVLEKALHAGSEAATALVNTPPEAIASFLEAMADRIEANAPAIASTAAWETALPEEPRLANIELSRTTDQLRQAANAARSRSWTMATIDTAHNIRSMYRPLGGAVVIFGPNNFPLAFNAVSGGDFAAAIGSGNPVIAKANPGHPGTTQLLAEAALAALQESQLHPATVQMFYHCAPDDGLRLVSHSLVGASAFTGSRAGLHLKRAADEAGKPIYLEMSSVNPVFLFPGALSERLDEIVADFGGSCLLGGGQFCTNPGLVFLLQNAQSEQFLARVATHFRQAEPEPLLDDRAPQQIQKVVNDLRAQGAQVVVGGQSVEGSGSRYANTLLRANGDAFLADPQALQQEAFGPVSLLVFVRDADQLEAIVDELEGSLTGIIYSSRDGADEELYQRLGPLLQRRVGRLLNDKMPTGVAVSPAMVHGGPYPATGHPGFTAVGIPAALRRFGRLQCYDNVRHHRLPPELQDANPTGVMWRFIDRDWTQADIS